MKMDPQVRRRIYLKNRRAFHIFGCEPEEGETVVDLGAAPGAGVIARSTGATVTAVDNGPLKGAVKSIQQILIWKRRA